MLTRPFANLGACKAALKPIELPAPKPAPVHKLVDEKTGAEISLPARMKCWDGYEITIKAFQPSRYQSSGGYITTDLNETFVADVVGAKIVVVAA